MKRILDWVATIPFLLLFGLTLVVYDVAGRIVRPFSLRGFEVVMAALPRTLMALFRVCGTRIEVERSPAIQPNTGYLVVSNHQSLFDIALLGGILFSNFPKYVAKKELGRWIPSVSLNLRRGGNVLIDRRDRGSATAAIADAAREAQRRNVSMVIFPEGTRSRDGNLRRFKRVGAEAMLAAADRLACVPAAIDGSWRLLRNNLLPVPFGTRVRIRLGDPIPRSPGDASEVLAKAEAFIVATLGEWQLPSQASAG